MFLKEQGLKMYDLKLTDTGVNSHNFFGKLRMFKWKVEKIFLCP